MLFMNNKLSRRQCNAIFHANDIDAGLITMLQSEVSQFLLGNNFKFRGQIVWDISFNCICGPFLKNTQNKKNKSWHRNWYRNTKYWIFGFMPCSTSSKVTIACMEVMQYLWEKVINTDRTLANLGASKEGSKL
jgi:hypothetical protein